MSYKYLIFDFDNTLFDYKKSEKYSILKCCKKFNIYNKNVYSIYLEVKKEMKNIYPIITYENIYDYRMERIGLFLKRINAEVNKNEFLENYLLFMEKPFLKKNVYNVLKKLRDYKIIVATNSTKKPKKNCLVKSKINKFVYSFYSCDILNASKPSKDFFDKIIRLEKNKNNDIKSKEFLVIGDDVFKDYQGALNSGLDCCIIGSKLDTISSDHEVYFIDNITEILKLLKN